MSPHSMAHEVLPQGRCKPVFLNMQGNRIKSNQQNNIMVNFSNDDIILDSQIKTHDGWVARVNFLQETTEERTQSATANLKKNINSLHVKLSHSTKSITHATAKAMDI